MAPSGRGEAITMVVSWEMAWTTPLLRYIDRTQGKWPTSRPALDKPSPTPWHWPPVGAVLVKAKCLPSELQRRPLILAPGGVWTPISAPSGILSNLRALLKVDRKSVV